MQESQNDRPHAEEGGAGAAGRGQGQRREHQGQEAKQVLWFGLSPGSQPSKQRRRRDGPESSDDATRASGSHKRRETAIRAPEKTERELLDADMASVESGSGRMKSKRSASFWLRVDEAAGAPSGPGSRKDATQASDERKRAGWATHTPKEAERELLGAGKAGGGSRKGRGQSKR